MCFIPNLGSQVLACYFVSYSLIQLLAKLNRRQSSPSPIPRWAA